MSDLSAVKSVTMQIVRFLGCLGVMAGLVAIIWAIGGYRLILSSPHVSDQAAPDSQEGLGAEDVAASSSLDNSAGSSLDD